MSVFHHVPGVPREKMERLSCVDAFFSVLVVLKIANRTSPAAALLEIQAKTNGMQG
jgi:hypothetical protein